MDEAQITQKLAAQVQTPPPEPKTDTPPEEPEREWGNTPLPTEHTTNAIFDYLNLPPTEKYSHETQQRLKVIAEWAAKGAQSADTIEILNYIKTRESMRGIAWNDDRVFILYKIAKLEAQREHINRELGLYNG